MLESSMWEIGFVYGKVLSKVAQDCYLSLEGPRSSLCPSDEPIACRGVVEGILSQNQIRRI